MKTVSNTFMIIGLLWFIPKLLLLSFGELCTPKEDLLTGLFWICDVLSMITLMQYIFSMLWLWILSIILLLIWVILWWISFSKNKIYKSFSSILLFLSSAFLLFILSNMTF